MRFRHFTETFTAIALLAGAFPGQRKSLWTCKRCGFWLGALDLESGLVAWGHFGEECTYWDDPYFGRASAVVSTVLTGKGTWERRRIKCERCGVVNRRCRRG